MPTQWAHSLFWETQGAPPATFGDYLPLMGVGRGAIAAGIALGSPSLLPLLILLGVMLVPEHTKNKLWARTLKLFGFEPWPLWEFLHSKDGLMARDALNAKARWELDRPIKEGKALELAYLKAQQMGCGVSGWLLRFALYYWMGKKVGKW